MLLNCQLEQYICFIWKIFIIFSISLALDKKSLERTMNRCI